jgi:hypothetical protein
MAWKRAEVGVFPLGEKIENLLMVDQMKRIWESGAAC